MGAIGKGVDRVPVGGRESTRMMGPGSVCCDSMYKLGVIGMRYEEAIVRCEPAVVRDAPDLAFMQCHM